LGAAVGHALHGRGLEAGPTALLSLALLFSVPGLMAAESALPQEPPPLMVQSSIDIDAPRSVVWEKVISIPDLPAPSEWFFLGGVAYPKGAKIEGHGVGAVRRCVFSTGDFVEPITKWTEPSELEFSVASQPPVMRELSPYEHVHAPHLEDGFLRSER